MQYRRPPYKEYIKDWNLDMFNLKMTHKCGFVGRWLPISPRPSGIRPGFEASPEALEKFSEMMDERGYTHYKDKIRAFNDIIRQVEEIYVRNFKEKYDDNEYMQKFKHRNDPPGTWVEHSAQFRPAPKKLHWAPVSSMYQKLVKNVNRTQSR